MSGSDQTSLNPAEGDTGEELAKLPSEPLLPVEKKLIAWSLALGIALLGLLMWVSYTFFAVPVAPD
jgi:hypothetical protein